MDQNEVRQLHAELWARWSRTGNHEVRRLLRKRMFMLVITYAKMRGWVIPYYAPGF